MQNKKCIDSINQEVKVELKNNQEDERLKAQLEKEYNSIKIPSGLKEELWTQISTTRKKKEDLFKNFSFYGCSYVYHYINSAWVKFNFF